MKRTGFFGPRFRVVQLARGFWRKDCLDGNADGDGFWSGNDGPRVRPRRSRRSVVQVCGSVRVPMPQSRPSGTRLTRASRLRSHQSNTPHRDWLELTAFAVSVHVRHSGSHDASAEIFAGDCGAGSAREGPRALTIEGPRCQNSPASKERRHRLGRRRLDLAARPLKVLN